MNSIEPAQNSNVMQKAHYGLFFFIGLSITAFCSYSIIETVSPMIKGSVVLSLCLVMLFLTHPAGPKSENKPWDKQVGILLAVLSVITCAYAGFFWWDMAMRPGMPTLPDKFFGILLIVLILEACRRSVGIVLMLVNLVAIIYGFAGNYIPGDWGHSGFSVNRFVEMSYMYADAGIWGLPMRTATDMVIVFLIYSAFLQHLGASQVFIDFANALVGHYRGGPAKVAVVASSLFGMFSGSAVANVVGTGSITIPLMKKVGYKPHFAGAVEAVASSGGQIMPPVMGAAAFLMATMLEISYWKIVVAAVIPALLYYVAVFTAVHLEAGILGLSGCPKEDLPRVKDVFKQGWYLFLSPIVLVALMAIMRYSVGRAGLYATATLILTAISVEIIRGKSWGNMRKNIVKAISEVSGNAASITVTLASVGIIITVLGITGLGLKLSGLMVDIAGSNLFLLAGLSALASMILGMGLPTSAVYVIVAVTAAPALIKLGVLPLAAHFFVFYFGTIAVITPPVALAAFAAAGIAQADMMRTGWAATRLGLAAFIVPFMFIMDPALLMQGSPLEVLRVAATGVLGACSMAVSLQGYLFGPLRLLQRILTFVAALALIHTGVITDLIGIGLLALVIVSNLSEKRRGRGVIA